VNVLLAAVVGAVWGALAERLSARWPARAEGQVRALDWRSVAVPIASATAFAALAARWTEPRDVLILVAYAAVLMVLLATDLDQRLLPDILTLPLIPIVLAIVLLGWDPLLADKGWPIVSAVAAAVGAPLLLLLSDRVLGGGLGMGDVKLAVSLGLMSGVTRLVGGFLVASIAGALVLLVLIALRRLSLKSTVPFGPVLIAAGILAALLP
jgi:leader peptidase (prepilin peptidase)/N-methyltransferase